MPFGATTLFAGAVAEPSTFPRKLVSALGSGSPGGPAATPLAVRALSETIPELAVTASDFSALLSEMAAAVLQLPRVLLAEAVAVVEFFARLTGTAETVLRIYETFTAIAVSSPNVLCDVPRAGDRGLGLLGRALGDHVRAPRALAGPRVDHSGSTILALHAVFFVIVAVAGALFAALTAIAVAYIPALCVASGARCRGPRTLRGCRRRRIPGLDLLCSLHIRFVHLLEP